MASLIKPGNLKVTTNNGEIQVSLSIDLNLNLNGENIKFLGDSDSSAKFEKEKTEEKVEWAIPDFESLKIDFGKKKKEV